MGTLAKLWVVGVVALYTTSGLLGWRLGGAPRQKIDPSVRSSPGGYRSYHFWHTGFSGGK